MKWSNEEIQVLMDDYSSKTWNYLCNRLKRSRESIEKKALRLGLNRIDFAIGKRWTQKEKERLKELYESNESVQMIGKLLERSSMSISGKIRSMDLKRSRINNKNVFEIGKIENHVF